MWRCLHGDDGLLVGGGLIIFDQALMPDRVQAKNVRTLPIQDTNK